MDIKEFSDEQLKAEVARRKSIKGGVWPKEFILTIDEEVEHYDDFINFLEEKCGIIDGSPEFEWAISVLYNITFDIEIEKDGKAKIVKVDGRPVIEPIIGTSSVPRLDNTSQGGLRVWQEANDDQLIIAAAARKEVDELRRLDVERCKVIDKERITIAKLRAKLEKLYDTWIDSKTATLLKGERDEARSKAAELKKLVGEHYGMPQLPGVIFPRKDDCRAFQNVWDNCTDAEKRVVELEEKLGDVQYAVGEVVESGGGEVLGYTLASLSRAEKAEAELIAKDTEVKKLNERIENLTAHTAELKE